MTNDFIEQSLEIFKKFNSNKLFYQDLPSYDQLVTADAFKISADDFEIIRKNGPLLQNWVKEQKHLFREMFKSKKLAWLKEKLIDDTSKETLSYYEKLLDQPDKYTQILRADLSSLPYGCHEPQFRWAGFPYILLIPQIYEEVVNSSKSPNRDISFFIQKTIDEFCREKNESAIYLSPQKYMRANYNTIKILRRTLLISVPTLNEKNFAIKKGKLVHKETGLTIKLIFRHQISLATLIETTFGRKLIELYLDNNLHFEPDLDILNDLKLGMALVSDERTRSFFSDDSRRLFLKTAIAEKNMHSFNSVFNTQFNNYSDFIEKTTRSTRRYVYKYGGMDMHMSHGAREVYRLDDSENHCRRILNKNSRLWIIQQMDSTRYKFRFLKGDYTQKNTCEIVEDSNFSARFEVFYYLDGDSVEPITLIANLVNNHWKSRFKTSNQIDGEGSVVTPICIRK